MWNSSTQPFNFIYFTFQFILEGNQYEIKQRYFLDSNTLNAKILGKNSGKVFDIWHQHARTQSFFFIWNIHLRHLFSFFHIRSANTIRSLEVEEKWAQNGNDIHWGYIKWKKNLTMYKINRINVFDCILFYFYCVWFHFCPFSSLFCLLFYFGESFTNRLPLPNPMAIPTSWSGCSVCIRLVFFSGIWMVLYGGSSFTEGDIYSKWVFHHFYICPIFFIDRELNHFCLRKPPFLC